MRSAHSELALACLALALVSGAATAFVALHGWTLYYGDAEAHLNIARRVLDSRTPGYDQFGTVWLPLPHLLMLPLVWNDRLWRSGLAGAIPSSICFVLAGVFLFAAMRRATQSPAAAWTALGLFALNPNLLYLQSAPMTEPVEYASVMALLYFSVRYRDTQSWGAITGAGVAALAASMARYEGWFLIPFVALYFLCVARANRVAAASLFLGIAGLGPLYWLAHNWWLYSNPLEFYNGPYSAKMIYARDLALRGQPYAGDHDWRDALRVFVTAARLCVGPGTAAAAVAGLVASAWKRALWPVMLTALLPLFYVWSVHSGGTPIFAPALHSNGFYNTRYGLSALPFLAVAGGCLVLAAHRFRAALAAAIILAGFTPWLWNPHPEAWICWKESQVNSEARRAWTHEAAHTLAAEYRTGAGIFTNFGDLAGVYREAGIPLRETLHEGNVVEWITAAQRPQMFLHEAWVVGFAGSNVIAAAQSATVRSFPRYHLVRRIAVPGAPPIELYKRYEYYELP